MIRKIAGACLLVALAGCGALPKAVNTVNGVAGKVNDGTINDITTVLNYQNQDIANAIAVDGAIVPSTGKPANPSGLQCIQAIKTVHDDALSVLAAAGVKPDAKTPSGGGVFTQAAILDTFSPGSDLYNTEKTTLENGCAAWAQKKMIAVTGNVAQLAGAAGLLGLPVGM